MHFMECTASLQDPRESLYHHVYLPEVVSNLDSFTSVIRNLYSWHRVNHVATWPRQAPVTHASFAIVQVLL